MFRSSLIDRFQVGIFVAGCTKKLFDGGEAQAAQLIKEVSEVLRAIKAWDLTAT